MGGKSNDAVLQRHWFIVSRWQEFGGEGQVNLLRVIAIASFYAVHTVNWHFLVDRTAEFTEFHRQCNLLAAGWLFLSLAVIVALQRHYFPQLLKYLTTALDLLLATALITICGGPASRLTSVYFILIVWAGLRFSRPLVWAATVGCLLGYLTLVGLWDKTWFDAVHVTPVVDQLCMLVSLAIAGLSVDQILRRVPSLASDFADRALPNS